TLIPHLVKEYSWRKAGRKEPDKNSFDEKLEITYADAKNAIDAGRFQDLELRWEHKENLGSFGKLINAYIEGNAVKGVFEFNIPDESEETGTKIGETLSYYLRADSKNYPIGPRGLSLSHHLCIDDTGQYVEVHPTEVTICEEGARGPLAAIEVQASTLANASGKLKKDQYTIIRPISLDQPTATANSSSSSTSTSAMSQDEQQAKEFAEFLKFKEEHRKKAAAEQQQQQPEKKAEESKQPLEKKEEGKEEEKTEEEIVDEETLFSQLADKSNVPFRTLGQKTRLSILKALAEGKEAREKLKEDKERVEKEKENLIHVNKENLALTKLHLGPFLKERDGKEPSDAYMEDIIKGATTGDPIRREILVQASNRIRQETNKRKVEAEEEDEDPDVRYYKKKYYGKGKTAEERVNNTSSSLRSSTASSSLSEAVKMKKLDEIRASQTERQKIRTEQQLASYNPHGFVNNDPIRKQALESTRAYQNMVAMAKLVPAHGNPWIDNQVYFDRSANRVQFTTEI